MESELFYAIKDNDLDKVKILIENGIDLEVKYGYGGYTPLMEACSYGNFEIIKLLIDKGVNVNTKNNSGRTALMSTGYDFEIVKLLIDNGADVNIIADNGDTPLINLFSDCDGDIEKDFETAKLLVENGVDINAKNEYGRTALHYTYHRNTKVTNYLIEKGADMNIGVNEVFLSACEVGDYETVKLLFDKGLDIDINTKNSYGYTGLSFACGNGNNIEIAKLLLDKGANVDYCLTDCIYKFEDYKINELLINKYIDENNINEEVNEALIYSIEERCFDIAKLLINKGADVNTKNEYENTVLMYACEYGNFEIVKLVIDKGANVNVKNNSGNTALMEAFSGSYNAYDNTKKEEYINIIKLLIDSGANINAKNDDNDKFLDLLGDDYVEKEIREYLKTKKKSKALKPLNLKLPEDIVCFDEIGHCDILVKDFVKSVDTILIKIGDNIKGYNRPDIITYYNTKKSLYSKEKLYPGEFEKIKNKKNMFFSTVDTGNNTLILIPQTKEKFFS